MSWSGFPPPASRFSSTLRHCGASTPPPAPDRFARSEHQREHLKRRQHAVPRRRLVEEHVGCPDCSPSQVEAALPHRLDHVAVAHLGAHERRAGSARARAAGPGSTSPSPPRSSSGSFPSQHHDPSGAHPRADGRRRQYDPFSSTTITRSASPSSAMPIAAPRFTTSAATWSGCSAPASLLMLSPRGLDADRQVTWAPSSRSTIGGHPVRRAMRRVDDDLHAVERQVAREGLLEEDHVAPAPRLLQLLRAPDGGPGGSLAEQLVVPHEVFDLELRLVRQLEAIGPEDLDAVVLVRVVARADDDPRVTPACSR